MLTGIALACFFSLSHAFNFDPSHFGFGSGLACELAKCLRGTCVNSSSFPFYECDCDPGWKTPSHISWLPCIVPNCTFDLTCANTSKSSHVAPPPLFPPLGVAFDICSLPVCGNGECVHDNSSTADDQYSCKCDDGFVNFRNKLNGYCIHKCSLGADCSNLTVGHSLGGASHSSRSPPPQILSTADSNHAQDKAYLSGPIMLATILALMGMYI